MKNNENFKTMTPKKRKKSLVGYVNNFFIMYWDVHGEMRMSIPYKEKTVLKNCKVKVTIEEIGGKKN